MFHIWKIILYVIRELVFDSKDEYDFNSAKFNYRKFTVAIMLGLSLAANVWLTRDYLILAHVRTKCETQLAIMIADEKKVSMCLSSLNTSLIPPEVKTEPDKEDSKKASK